MAFRGSFRCSWRCFHLRIILLVVITQVKTFVLNTLLVIVILLLINYFTVDNFLTFKNSIRILLTGVFIALINYKFRAK